MAEVTKRRLPDMTAPPVQKSPEQLKPGRIFWDSKTNGFFDTNLSAKIPEGAVEIPIQEWRAVLNEHAMKGKNIITGPDGKPIAADPVMTPEMKRHAIEAQIDQLRRAPDTLDLQRAAALGTPGAKEQLQAIENQIQALRATLPPLEAPKSPS